MGSYRKEEIFEEYRPAVQELRVIIGELAGMEGKACEHGEIEKHLQRRGMEAVRRSVAKTDVLTIDTDEALIADGDAMGISTEIFKHLLGTGQRWLEIHDPRLLAQRTDQRAPPRLFSELLRQSQCVVLPQGVQRIQIPGSKHPRQRLHRK